jgi:hypothetical protein
MGRNLVSGVRVVCISKVILSHIREAYVASNVGRRVNS